MKKILVVEDEKSIANLLKNILESKEEYEVITKNDGLDAYVEFQMNKYDLVITDLMMPTHGFQLIELIRKIDEEIPIIVLTAVEDEYDKQESLNRGANKFLKKPFKNQEFLETVKLFL